ncbi:hypothetical protein [Kribbella sp. CA-247076]|uniref:hypothetical protein n=1 Tax=Kribbella sp. CA-247076 TaxID=3239941 RepID=UPI003D94E029
MAVRRTTGNIVVVGVVTLLVAGLLAFGWLRGRLPGETSGLDDACTGKVYDNAAAYEGAAPHPIAVFIESETGELEHTSPYFSEEGWELVDPDEPEDVQLVACATVDGEQSLGAEHNCEYGATGSTTIPMVTATYQLRVYELRTHREVRSITLEGQEKFCPHSIPMDDPPPRMLTRPTPDQWRKALADLTTQNH